MGSKAAHARGREIKRAWRAMPQKLFAGLAAALPDAVLVPPEPMGRMGHRLGSVYIGRDQNGGAVKIGFTRRDPLWRLLEQRLTPLAAIHGVCVHTERALHQHFASEAMGRERFTGPRVEAFVERLTGKPAPDTERAAS